MSARGVSDPRMSNRASTVRASIVRKASVAQASTPSATAASPVAASRTSRRRSRRARMASLYVAGLTEGTMQTAAGGGDCGGPPCGEGGPAGDAELNRPRGVTSMPDGGYLIADTSDHRIRRVFGDGHIATVAGGAKGFGGDGGPATRA